DPLVVFFVSEVTLLSKVIGQTASFFADLKRVAEGVLIPNDNLKRDATDLLGGNVPEQWLDRMDGPRDVHQWLATLKTKYKAVCDMHQAVESNGADRVLQGVNLKHFLRPHTFLNAFRQYTARKFFFLKRVAEGVLIPNDNLKRDATDLLGGNVPEQWLDRMDGPRDVHQWLATLKTKYKAVCDMHQAVESNGADRVLQGVNLKHFLRPHTFLNAFRQYTARKTNEPLVNLVLAAYMSGAVGASGGVSATIKGEALRLQGAMIRGSGITAVDNNAPSSAPFTDVLVSWVRSEKFSTGQYVSIPMYSNTQRELLVMEVQVPCASAEERNRWILGGVALFLA
ncbi:dynein heavy chain, putative, partial [Bodo saltans]